MNQANVFFIIGPTAVGKSNIAIEIARKFPCEIISVDSAMIYRGMDIGTGKPDKSILQEIPHHLIDICEPNEKYSVAQFVVDAKKHIKEILQRNKVPLLVGGTMLYVKALQQGIAELPGGDKTIRQQLEQEAESVGLKLLHQRLQQVDPIAAQRIHPNDPQRLLRALEVYMITGKPLSEIIATAEHQALKYPTKTLAIVPQDRSVLHQWIEKRFIQMLDQGLLDEVKKLRNRGDLNLALPAMRAVGYRQVWEYLDGNIDKSQMQHRAIVATRQLAKRQLTWLRSMPNVHCVDMQDQTLLEQIIVYFNLKKSY